MNSLLIVIGKVKSGIRECLVRLEPAISAYKRPPNLETALGFLEEVDEAGGGQDAFRTWLRSSIEASLRKQVRDEVQLQCRETSLTPEKMKMVAPAILSKILETSEMKGKPFRGFIYSTHFSFAHIIAKFQYNISSLQFFFTKKSRLRQKINKNTK